jgi:hypothetical protein
MHIAYKSRDVLVKRGRGGRGGSIGSIGSIGIGIGS